MRADRPLLERTLYDRRVVVRAASLAALGVSLHLVAWTLAYHLLPAEALKGVFLSSRLPVVGGSEGDTLVRILVVNVFLGLGLVAVANTIRVGRFPLGYLPVLFHWTAFGLLHGTGSFGAARAPVPPSAWTLVRSRGSWEILAYTIAAAATVELFLFRQRSWTDWSTRRERSLAQLDVSRGSRAALVAALLLLVAANWTEAVSLVGR